MSMLRMVCRGRIHLTIMPRHAVAVLLLLLALATAAGATPLGSVPSVGLTVANADRAAAFYAGVLGFERVADVEVAGPGYDVLTGLANVRMRVVTLRLFDEVLELTQYLTPVGRPIPAGSRSHDHWFQHIAIIVSDMDRAHRWLRERGVEKTSPEPQRLPDWNPNAGGIKAYYFKDPDGHALEILEFPAGKGHPKWQRAFGRLFLGIDHTAIVVADTERSLRFYRDALGMTIVGRSENHGPEQERLNDVVGAHLRITTLRAGSGIDVELLEYRTPRDGRAMPPEVKVNDLMHWHVTMETVVADTAARVLNGRIATLPDAALGFRKAFFVRDPDGHAVRVTAR
jgi:catechol 2,3-dioxygenase-like lactoylglutathione lyase family enzyme